MYLLWYFWLFKAQIYTIYIMTETIEIRTIELNDNKAIASIIKNTLIEFGGNKPGTAFNDISLNNMFEAYNYPKAAYFIATLNKKPVGGCGIKALDGGETHICELQKMYIASNARGKKIGKKLLNTCLEFAKKAGFKMCYIETFPHMYAAINIYKMNGFEMIDHPMGNTGHNACEVWMLKNLNQ